MYVSMASWKDFALEYWPRPKISFIIAGYDLVHAAQTC